MNLSQNPAAKARHRVTVAQAALDQALAAGEPTEQAREALSLAESELLRIGMAEEEEARRDHLAHTAEIEAQARAMVDEAEAIIEAELADLSAVPVPLVELPRSLAEALLEAQGKATGMKEAYQHHLARLEALRDRQAALAAQRQEIIHRRMSGAHDPKDGQRLTLLGADLEGLSDLIERTEAEAWPPDSDTELTQWQGGWEKAVKEARRAALLALAKDLEARLILAAGRLTEGASISAAGRYIPDHRLVTAVHRGVW